MLSATTKMELRIDFCARLFQVLGTECYNDTAGDKQWLEIMRAFMAGRLIKIRRINESDGSFRFEIEL